MGALQSNKVRAEYLPKASLVCSPGDKIFISCAPKGTGWLPGQQRKVLLPSSSLQTSGSDIELIANYREKKNLFFSFEIDVNPSY